MTLPAPKPEPTPADVLEAEADRLEAAAADLARVDGPAWRREAAAHARSALQAALLTVRRGLALVEDVEALGRACGRCGAAVGASCAPGGTVRPWPCGGR